MNYSKFDLEEWLEENNIEYWTVGKNISEGWIGIQCPFCDDSSNHLGINIESKGFSCWKCGAKGSFFTLLKQLQIEKVIDTSYADLQNYTQGYLKPKSSKERIVHENIIHKSFQDKLLRVHGNWLKSRRFSPLKTFEKYKLRCCGPVGRHVNRLIIPFIEKRKWITYTARDVTGQSDIPYEHFPDIPTKDYLYNYENAKDKAIVVEGVTDAWRIGDGAVATMGVQYTEKQIKLLLKFKQIFILFDSDAVSKAEQLEQRLSIFNKDVYLWTLSEGDPGDLSDKDVKSLRKDVFGKIY